jgi:hypothetical protein
MGAGAIWKQHWLFGCSGVISNLGFMTTVLVQRKEYARIMQRESLLRASGGRRKPGTPGRLVYRFAIAALSLSTVFQVIEILIKTSRAWLLSASLLFLVSAGSLALLPLLRAWVVLRLGSGSADPAGPPSSAKFILLLVPKRHREHLVGDLEEEYSTVVLPEYGAKKARLWYWWQVLASIAPLLWPQIKRIVSITWLLRRVR